MSSETLEKVKIEIRSILLSSKHGVAAESIQSDYEMLMCQRVPLKELGFRDVHSLMRAMPDVAKEVRSQAGEITYHAVCDESTAHIKKLVSNQITKRKKKFPATRRGKRHDILGRGVFVATRRRSPGTRGGLNGGTKQFTIRSRAPEILKPGQPRKMTLTYRDSHDHRSEHWGGIGDTEHVDQSTADDAKFSQKFRAIVGRGAVNPSSHSQPDATTDSYKQKSLVYNLKIGVSQSGQREISKLGQPLWRNGDADDGTPTSQFDLRDLLNQRRLSAATVKNHDESASNNIGRHAEATTVRLNSGKNKKVMDNRFYVPPRFQRLQHQNSAVKERPASPVHTTDLQQHYSDENTVYFLDGDNWKPPKDGELYLEAFNNYFAQRGESAPAVEILPGKFKKQKGFYGRLNHQDIYYYPLEIMPNEELARQNVVRAFCQKNEISLLHNGQLEVNSTNSSSRTSPAVHGAQQVESVETKSAQSPEQKVNDSHVSCQQQSTDGHLAPAHHKASDLPETLEKVYKILKPNGIWLPTLPDLYKTTYGETLNLDFLTVASQWPQYFTIEKLAGNRYTVYPVANNVAEKTVIENTKTQVLVPPALQPAAGEGSRYIVHPVANNVAENTNTENIKIKTQVLVPPALQPAARSKLQMFFSFAYSAEDVYLQRADMENLVYEIDDLLNENCPASSPPEVHTVVLNSLVAANYEKSWYRAQVLAVEKTAVKVYFIDYGNTEEVSFADLRPIPQNLTILNTPSLAIKCALRNTKAGEWLKDVISFLTDLSETESVLSAEIVEHKGDKCIVDLYTSDGDLVNDMLLESVFSPGLQRITESVEQVTQQSAQTRSSSAAAVRLFTDDPEPLVIPDNAVFAVYVCRVMSENTVLLRIVDDEYSDRLDELEQGIADNFYFWPIPEKVRLSNIYACMVLAGAEDAEDVEYDEEGEEKLSDQNKYHRVRVLKEHTNGNCDCYLPDHGHNETLNLSQLREIDPQLNRSISYQAVMAKLHGLDNLPDKLKPMAVRLLIKLLTNGATFYAVKKGKSAEKRKDDPGGGDVKVTIRVRKIISCMRDIHPSSVAKVYQDIYSEPLENVEEVIKNIPGYGYWRESLEVDLVDTSQEDSDVNINEYVLSAIEEMYRVQSCGGSVENVWRDMFSSDTSQADTDGGSLQEELDDLAGNERLQDDMNLVDTEVGRADADAKPDLVRGCVQDLPASTVVADDSVKPASGKALYTWNTNPGTSGAASCPSPTPSQATTSATSVCDNSRLPKFWSYPLLKFVSLQIVRVENPSDFVAIPVEQRGALEKLEMAIAQYFSANKAEAAVSCAGNVLYAVKSKDVYRRALYVNQIGDVAKVFFPDHHFYDTVQPSELFSLPERFYSLPFLARKMRLGGILPPGPDWPAHVNQWFKATVGNKCLYALVTGEDGQGNNNQYIPGILIVRLIDTSGSEDLVVEEYMENQGMAVHDPSSD